MKISKSAQAIEPSLTRKLFNMAQGYDDVIDLTLGDPDIQPLDVIKESACKSIMEGKTRYSANAGLIELRQAICRHFNSEYEFDIDPKSNVLVTVGGMEALYLSLACLIDEGDEVILQAPYYVNYAQMIRACGGVPVIINTNEEEGFSFDAIQIEAAITEKTVAIIINTPCNPTGEVLSDDKLDSLSKIVLKYGLVVISDEVYSSLIYDGKKHSSIITRPGMKDRTILIDSISKRFSMTGYRLGYVVAPKEFVSAMTKMQENVAACAPLPSQYAAITAYNECSSDTSLRNAFSERRDCIYNGINSIHGLSCRKPAATFYLFVNISETGLSSIDFAEKLLESQHVAVAPGITYGTNYDNYIRIAYTLEISKLEEAISRISAFMEGLSK